MTEVLLTLGSALLAFGPFISLFSIIAYQKAQLVIVVTTAAFFFLLASVGAGLFWYILDVLFGLSGPLIAIIPGVFCQFIGRCSFVALYHKVEGVIQISIQRQREQQQREGRSGASSDDNNNIGDQDDNAAVETTTTAAGIAGSDEPIAPGRRSKSEDWTEAAKLRLELNDASCGVAAGIGYGGMHATLFYGTLLANQTSNNVGVLYQDSCAAIPSLVVSALFAFCFTILDVFWMLLTFFGMRRRLLYHRGGRAPNENRALGGWLGNSRSGGNMALLIALASHLTTSLFTTTDSFKYGCGFSLPAVGFMVLATSYIFWAGVGRIYMPPRRQQRNHILRTMNPGRGGDVTDFERHDD